MSYKATVVTDAAVLKESRPGVRLIHEVDLNSINVIITVGGDGTILWAHKYFKHTSVPPIIAFDLVLISFQFTST